MANRHADTIGDFWERARASGMGDPVAVAEQLAILLVLRITGEQPDRWRTVVDQRTFDLFVRDYPLWQPGPRERAFACALDNARLGLLSGRRLEDAVMMINALGDDRQEYVAFFDEVMDQLVYGGRQNFLRTPDDLADLMVALVCPQPDETVADPACGGGGLLVRVSGARSHDAGELRGYDVDPRLVCLAATALGVRGIHNVTLEPRNSLAAGHEWMTSDVILTNPPFAQVSEDRPDPELGTAGGRTELLFIERARMMLAPGGRCAILVPQSALFSGAASHRQVRENLVEFTSIEAIVSLSNVAMAPSSRLNLAIIVFHNGFSSDPVLFYEPTVMTATIPDAIAAARTALQGGQEHHVDALGEAWWAATNAIREAEYDLAPQRYRPYVEREPYPTPREILAEIREVQASINDQLDLLDTLLAP